MISKERTTSKKRDLEEIEKDDTPKKVKKLMKEILTEEDNNEYEVEDEREEINSPTILQSIQSIHSSGNIIDVSNQFPNLFYNVS